MKTINLAMIGAGSVAKPHSAGLLTLPVYFPSLTVKPVRKVICDIREEAAREGAERYGWEEYSTDWKEVVRRQDVDLVMILTPNELHADIAVAAADAGKMIYCEKPLTMDVQDGRRMVEAAKNNGVRTALGYNKRRFPAVIYTKKLIDDGYIGEPIYFHGTYLGSMHIDPDFPYSWRMDSGVVRETGCHIMDMCRYLLGDFDKICAVTKNVIKERPMIVGFETNTSKMIGDKNNMVPDNSEDFVSFMIQLKNGAVASFENSFVACGHYDGAGFQVYGTKGAIKWEAKHGSEIQISSTSDPDDQQGFKVVEMGAMHPHCFWPFAGFGVNWADLKAIEIYEMLDAFSNDKPFSPDFKDGLKVVEASDAIYQSASNNNEWVKLPE